MKLKVISSNFLFLMILLNFYAIGQEVKLTVSRDTATIGDQINIILELESFNSENYELIEWFEFSDTLQNLKLIKGSKIDTLIFNGLYYLKQSFLITFFDTGDYVIPSSMVKLKNISTNEELELFTRPHKIFISPVNTTHLKTYNDVTEILADNAKTHTFDYIFLAFVILFCLIVVFAFWFYKKTRKQNKRDDLIEIFTIEEAYKKITELESDYNSNQISSKAFYDKLYNIIRVFYSKRFYDPFVLYCTTSEWIKLIEKLNVNKTTQSKFILILFKFDEKRFGENFPYFEYDDTILNVRSILSDLNKL